MPHWADVYLTTLSKAEIADQLTQHLAVQFTERDSYYLGIYYGAKDRNFELKVKQNFFEGDELVHPDIPDSVFIEIEGTGETEIRSRLGAEPNLTLFTSEEWE